MKINLRELQSEEVKEFKADISSDEFMREVANEDMTSVRIYVAYDLETKEKIGYVAYDIYNSRNACICYLYVKENYRGLGFGKEILRKIINKLKKKFNYLYGFAVPENEIALRMYCKYYKFLGKNKKLISCDYYQCEELLRKNDENNYEVCFYEGV